MHNLVVFSGAGMSAESGLSTFRDQNGLWDKYPIEEVATPNAWNKDPEKVLRNAVKGMLPKNRLNRKIINKLKVYSGENHPHEAQNPEVIN